MMPYNVGPGSHSIKFKTLIFKIAEIFRSDSGLTVVSAGLAKQGTNKLAQHTENNLYSINKQSTTDFCNKNG